MPKILPIARMGEAVLKQNATPVDFNEIDNIVELETGVDDDSADDDHDGVLKGVSKRYPLVAESNGDLIESTSVTPVIAFGSTLVFSSHLRVDNCYLLMCVSLYIYIYVCVCS